MLPSKFFNFTKNFYFIPCSTLIEGFTEVNLTPLQASTILLRADQRRTSSNPPLPPITCDQIAHGELVSLLEESDYNLTIMVNLKPYHIIYSNNYLLYIWYLPLKNVFTTLGDFFQSVVALTSFHIWVIVHHMLYNSVNSASGVCTISWLVKLKSLYVHSLMNLHIINHSFIFIIFFLVEFISG